MIDNLVNSGLLITDALVSSQVFLIIDRDAKFYIGDRWSDIYWSSTNEQSYELKSFYWQIICKKFLQVLP